MISIIKGGQVFAPTKQGIKDILVVAGKIIAIEDSISVPQLNPEIIDATGKMVCPGFIDQHVHITGGGGQYGFNSFIPELFASDLLETGTTTVLGLLGTDGFVKELSTLYRKAKALDETGVTAFMLTNYYGLPEKTICDSIAKDLIFIDKIIGCKLALSDDRSAFPDEKEILRIINQVRLGGFTSNKGGILHIHMGGLESGMDTLFSIVDKYPTLINYISPTHCSRTSDLFDDAIKFAKLGGMIDISTGGTTYIAPYLVVERALKEGVPLDNITFSTDGRGGVRSQDSRTGEDIYKPAPLDPNLKELKLLVGNNILPLQDALRLITTNPAKNMKIKNKGAIIPGYDADFVIFDESMEISDVISGGIKRI